MLELYIRRASKYDVAGLKPMKRLMYTWFVNYYTLF